MDCYCVFDCNPTCDRDPNLDRCPVLDSTHIFELDPRIRYWNNPLQSSVLASAWSLPCGIPGLHAIVPLLTGRVRSSRPLPPLHPRDDKPN